MRDLAGSRILFDGYLVHEVLGAGGMGVVYRALDLQHQREVALKMLHARHVGNPVAIQRFESEERAGRSVHHPNVVAVHDSGISLDGTPYLVMELVRGQLLDKLIEQEGELPVRRVTAIVGQMLSGLQALHDARFVHGDVKTGNVLVESRGRADRVKLIDLGLARPPDEAGAVRARMASGTPEYMAPEVIRGDGTLPASDLYATGVVLYQLLTGTTPFEGGTSREILRRHLDDEVVPPSLRCPDRNIPGALERIVMIALAKDPNARQASAAAFAAALAAAPIAEAPPHTGRRPAVFSATAPTREWSHSVLAAPRPIAGVDRTERLYLRRDPELLARLGTRPTDLRLASQGSRSIDAAAKQGAG
ncbi:MAG TPA: serine/threonine-protein kinase [Kofleriaceae bacterium]|nr:serine/threonine-protein kinase [Kofleriaceae bacterium]